MTFHNRINENTRFNQKTLIIVYYGGHGMINDNHSQIVMPDKSMKIPLYNLEGRLRSLGGLDNSYVIGIFDCCRDKYTEDIFHHEVVKQRGEPGTEKQEVIVEKGRNVFLIFGCPQNKSVPAESKIAS